MTYLPTAHYLIGDVFARQGDNWSIHGGGSGGGLSWSLITDDDKGVLRYGDEAPQGAIFARVEYEGRESRVPVHHGHFLFVARNTSFSQDPKLLGFDRP